jgi:hypothetical protein
MSPKSKYNRRNISQNKPESTNPAEARPAATAQTVNTGSLKPTNTATANAKAIMDMTSSETFLSDLKWIGTVTAIILVLLIVAYFMFH